MTLSASNTRGDRLPPQHGDVFPVGRSTLAHSPTTATERFLLMATIGAVPLQNHLPTVGGFSVLFIAFGFLAGYLLLRRPGILGTIWRHRVFLAGYVLVCVGFIMETVHDSLAYDKVLSILFMIVGAVVVASLCRDRRALLFGIYGILIASIWLSTLLFLTFYGHIGSAGATDFQEANLVRSRVFSDRAFHLDLNTMAFFASQGVG